MNQDSSQNCTPQRGPPVCIDPRSPTKDIDRTPIQVDSTVSDENSPRGTPMEAGKPKRRSLRQKMFANKKKSLDNDELTKND
ncbi:unnamed protein product [Caenorhabditis bovis]|uniref:Uncharacterized protein n=1 Tax=Caenorhabditis bovis TaxID=2654633 RepID=A0A8S1EPM1_9PELO|nr:unnamed protein product [Caenorhabditis bovis]